MIFCQRSKDLLPIVLVAIFLHDWHAKAALDEYGFEYPSEENAEEISWMHISTGVDYSLGVSNVNTGLFWGVPYGEREKTFMPPGFLWSKLFAGYTHSCGITNDSPGIEMCWGRPHEGQLEVPDGYNFEFFTLGEGFSCALSDRKEVLCWGVSNNRQLLVPPNKKWLQVSAGPMHVCGLTTRGKILCWGHDGYGRLAVPFHNETNIFWEAVSCGNRHCCGLLSERALKIKRRRFEDNCLCWGDNEFEQLNVPAQVQGRSGFQEKFREIAAGHSHTCGLTLDNKLWCWGLVNPYGLVSGIPGGNITTVVAGGHHACALNHENKARCWGYNHYGQIDVPTDWFTMAPSIMEYENAPYDMWPEMPWKRVTLSDQKYPALESFQFIHMAFYKPEFALPGSVKLMFEQYLGTAAAPLAHSWRGVHDPCAPHEVYFVASFEPPGMNVINISAFDLRYYHDMRWGLNPAVDRVESQCAVGELNGHGLVAGAHYRVTFSYRDRFEHPPGVHRLEEWIQKFDLLTEPPILRSPYAGRWKQALDIQYELLEDMIPDSVWIILTHVGSADPTDPDSAYDDKSPHEIQLAPIATTKGNHTFLINLLNTQQDLYGNQNPYVARTFQNGQMNTDRALTNGGEYLMTLRCQDLFNNAPQMINIEGIRFFADWVTEPVKLIRPLRLTNPLYWEYVIPELIYPTTLRFELEFKNNRPNEPLALIDQFSPHVFTVTPEFETPFDTQLIKLSTANLFRLFGTEAGAFPMFAACQ